VVFREQKNTHQFHDISKPQMENCQCIYRLSAIAHNVKRLSQRRDEVAVINIYFQPEKFVFQHNKVDTLFLVGGFVGRFVGRSVRRSVSGFVSGFVGRCVGRSVSGFVFGFVFGFVGGFVCGLVSGLVCGLIVLFVFGFSFVFDFSDVARVAIIVVGNHLATTIGKNDIVLSLGVVSVTALAVAHIDVGVVVFHGVIEVVLSWSLSNT